jgi:hypothetical protein
MRLCFLTLYCLAVISLGGCKDKPKSNGFTDNNDKQYLPEDFTKALDIVRRAKGGQKPTKAEVNIVYKQLKREGMFYSEEDVEELLNVHADLYKEKDPAKRLALAKRGAAIEAKGSR